jgi:transposase-like protein
MLKYEAQYSEISFHQFLSMFPTEQSCFDYLFKIRWPQGFVCPRCGHGEYSFHSTRRLYQCKGCAYQASVTAGTIFHRTRTPLKKWFLAIFLIARQKVGVSAMGLQRMLDIKNYQTAWLMSHKIRNAMVDRDTAFHLAGIAEISQSYLDSDKKSDEKDCESKTLVAVCIENHGERPGFVSLRVINDADTQDNIQQTSMIYGKERLVNQELSVNPENMPINESASIKSASAKNQHSSASEQQPPLKWIQTLMGNVKTTIAGVFHGVSRKHLQRFLDEYCFRFNRRHNERELFERLLAACSRKATVSFAELIK